MLASVFHNHDAYLALTVVHVLLCLTWLGVDTGVFYASWRLRRAGASAETRLELTRASIALSLTFTSGWGLRTLSDVQLNVISRPLVLIAAVMAWALVRHETVTARGRTPTPSVVGYEIVLKVIKLSILIFFGVTAVSSLTGGGPWADDYVAVKALLFALVTVAGQWIEYGFRDSAPTFGDLPQNGKTPERHPRLNQAIVNAYPPVLTLRALVTAMALVGIARKSGAFWLGPIPVGWR